MERNWLSQTYKGFNQEGNSSGTSEKEILVLRPFKLSYFITHLEPKLTCTQASTAFCFLSPYQSLWTQKMTTQVVIHLPTQLFFQPFTLSTSSSTTPHSVWFPLSPVNAQTQNKDTSSAWTSSGSYQKSFPYVYPTHPSVADTIFCCPEVQRKCLLAIIL